MAKRSRVAPSEPFKAGNLDCVDDLGYEVKESLGWTHSTYYRATGEMCITLLYAIGMYIWMLGFDVWFCHRVQYVQQEVKGFSPRS